MENLAKQVIYNGEVELTVKGRGYVVKPLPLQYIVNEDFQKSGLIIPQDKNNPGQFQLYNVDTPEKREMLDRWLRELVSLDGVAMSLDLALEHQWDIVDLGRFLDIVVQISG